jgi:hypothetical protein
VSGVSVRGGECKWGRSVRRRGGKCEGEGECEEGGV